MRLFLLLSLARAMSEQLWRVVGGGDKGGIVVRIGCGVQSAQLDNRLSTGSIVRELGLFQGRLNYELVKGDGPDEGWVSLKLKEKDLLVKTDGADAASPALIPKAGQTPLKSEIQAPTPEVNQSAGEKSLLPKRPVLPADGALELEDFVARISELEKVLESAEDPEIMEKLEKLQIACMSTTEEKARMRNICIWARFNLLLSVDIRTQKSKVSGKRWFESNLALQAALGGSTEDICVAQPSETFTGQVFYIFGWGGSGLQDLEDAKQFYSKTYPGALTIALVASGRDPRSLACIAEGFELAVNAWADASGIRPSMSIHLFSNMGAMATEYLTSIWLDQAASPDRSRLRGDVPSIKSTLRSIIWDSSPDEFIPFEPSMESITNSMAALYGSMVGVNLDGTDMERREAMKQSMEGKMENMRADSLVRTYLGGDQEKLFNMTRPTIDKIREFLLPVQMCFIYSTVDKVIPFQGVERFIAECETRLGEAGLPAPKRLKFEDSKSAHCFHKKVHTEEYWSAVSSFLADVL